MCDGQSSSAMRNSCAHSGSCQSAYLKESRSSCRMHESVLTTPPSPDLDGPISRRPTERVVRVAPSLGSPWRLLPASTNTSGGQDRRGHRGPDCAPKAGGINLDPHGRCWPCAPSPPVSVDGRELRHSRESRLLSSKSLAHPYCPHFHILPVNSVQSNELMFAL